MSSVVAVIRASALQQNLATVRRSAPGCAVMAVIKANAYGHGIVEVGRILAGAGADALAVARMHEAVQLREGGIDSPGVCLAGFSDPGELNLAIDNRIQIVVHALRQVDMLERATPDAGLPVWLKIDTGMGRLGVAPAEGRAAFERLRACRAVADGIGLMTHLACADDAGDATTERQISLLQGWMGDWDGDISVANSAGILGWPDTTAPSGALKYTGRNWVRPGLMLYGVSPFTDRSAADLGLRPAMSLQALVISIRHLSPGDAVGYGSTWRAERPTTLAVLGIGYADGLPWGAAVGGSVTINGASAPIVGRISMDLITVDVSDLSSVSIGDTAECWGDAQAVEAVATRAGTIPYEILTGVAARVTRQYTR